jgi:hypothetical protein
MIAYRDAVYFQRECAKLDIKVSVVRDGASIRQLNIMRGEFTDYDAARRYVQAYQAEQGARWAAYKQAKRTRRIKKWCAS